MSAEQATLTGETTEAGTDRCPVCGEDYDQKLRGKKVTIPDGYDDCKLNREYEGDVSTGIWYLHEVDEFSRWFYCPQCEREFGDPNAELFGTTLVSECGQCGLRLEKEVGR